MLRTTENSTSTSGQEKVLKDPSMDPIHTNEGKYKRRYYFIIFFSLCLFVCASYLISFQPVVFQMLPISKTSPNRIIEDLKERSAHLEKTCMSLQVKSRKISNLYIDKSHGLLYCIVPKCGSSYWLRFFYALDSNNYNPFNVIRYKIHQALRNKKNRGIVDELSLNRTVRFLVTRSPYSRLYSAYVDKLFLPEFWSSLGRNIIRTFRKNPTSLARLCGHDLTFAEFLTAISREYCVRTQLMNRHWRPIEQLCSPCTYKYNYIIKEETLFRDRDYLVSKMGIKDEFILNYNNISHRDYCLSAIKDLCHTIFIHFRHRKPSKCYRIKDLLQKLFISFQIQGYIREDASFDLGRFGDLKQTNIKMITEEFQRIYSEHPVLTRYDWQEQRKTFMERAYQFVDKEILEGIKKCYDLDFKIFDYDPEPVKLFGNRKKEKKKKKKKQTNNE